MYTKSLIQQHLERINLLESFKQSLNNMMDKYIIENSVFGITYKGESTEIVTGYFIVEKEFDNLNDCIKNINNNQYIQVKNNEKFIIGTIENNLFNCPYDKPVLDLETLKYVR